MPQVENHTYEPLVSELSEKQKKLRSSSPDLANVHPALQHSQHPSQENQHSQHDDPSHVGVGIVHQTSYQIITYPQSRCLFVCVLCAVCVVLCLPLPRSLC
jgi:hypothetical protein